jgi:hypothetical protein
MKIFNISFHKTGTSSFHNLMNQSKKKSFHNVGYFCKSIMNFENCYKNNIVNNYSNKNIDLHPKIKLDKFISYKHLDNLIDEYDAFSDMPFCYLYEYLDKTYPESLFIYIVRDDEEWYQSINNHSKKYSNMRKLIYGYGAAYENKNKYISVKKTHSNEVTKYFKDKDNFLKINLHDPIIGEKICNFCKFKKILSFPKKNITKNKSDT